MSDSGGRKYPRCKGVLLRAAFASNRAMKDRVPAYCRECSAAYYRQRQAAKGKTVRERLKSRMDSSSAVAAAKSSVLKSGQRAGLGATVTTPAARPAKQCLAGSVTSGEPMDCEQRTSRDLLLSSRCPICLVNPPQHVDHDHKTGKVRGVPCFTCNAAIGQLRDDPNPARRAAAYLEGAA